MILTEKKSNYFQNDKKKIENASCDLQSERVF